MTLAQNRVLARLRSGWETLFNKEWIEFDLQADSYVVTDAGHAAYLNASIH